MSAGSLLFSYAGSKHFKERFKINNFVVYFVWLGMFLFIVLFFNIFW